MMTGNGKHFSTGVDLQDPVFALKIDQDEVARRFTMPALGWHVSSLSLGITEFALILRSLNSKKLMLGLLQIWVCCRDYL